MLAEMTIPLELGGKIYTMRFTGNSMVAFEQSTGKFYLDTVQNLYDVIFPEGHLGADGKPAVVRIDGRLLVRKISMTDLRALLWATLHDYNAKDEPIWSLTEAQVGRLLNFRNIAGIFVKFLTGASANSPDAEELGKLPAEPKTAPVPAANEAPLTPAAGGGVGIVLPEGALD
jgi:hypothetical protein